MNLRGSMSSNHQAMFKDERSGIVICLVAKRKEHLSTCALGLYEELHRDPTRTEHISNEGCTDRALPRELIRLIGCEQRLPYRLQRWERSDQLTVLEDRCQSLRLFILDLVSVSKWVAHNTDDNG